MPLSITLRNGGDARARLHLTSAPSWPPKTYQFSTLDELRSILMSAGDWTHYSVQGHSSKINPLHSLDIEQVINECVRFRAADDRSQRGGRS